ncbi:MAG TPA: hypothetical protein VF476_04310 [Chitinophagaceae bacterium]
MKFLLCVLLFSTTAARAQTTDTTKGYVPETWDRHYGGIRASFGVHRHFFTELGYSLQRFAYRATHGFAVSNYYGSFEWTPKTSGSDGVYGIKLGAETIYNGPCIGLELIYRFNSNEDDFVAMPKIGFGLGLINLTYGYNISVNKHPFGGIGEHQFTLELNSNMLIHHWKIEKRKNRK